LCDREHLFANEEYFEFVGRASVWRMKRKDEFWCEFFSVSVTWALHRMRPSPSNFDKVSVLLIFGFITAGMHASEVTWFHFRESSRVGAGKLLKGRACRSGSCDSGRVFS